MVTSITEILDQTVSLHGEKIAVVDPEERITYRELHSSARAIATFILKSSAGCKSIAIYADKSVMSTCALWGIIYAGSSYTFIDTAMPMERIKRMCCALELDIILTDKMHRSSIENIAPSITIICIEEIIQTKIDNAFLSQARNFCSCSDPLYINFTSGTTGQPKGVVIRQYSVIDFIENFISLFSITPKDVIGNQAPFDFDVSVKDIFSSAFTGATLVIIPRSYFTNPKLLLDYICDEQITTLIWAVSAMSFISIMKGFMYRKPTEISKVMFSGEIMPLRHLQYWRENLKNATFINLYGPTEITCNCTYHILNREVYYEDGVPIGIAFPNNRIFLFDESGQIITGKNIEGEICVSGICLSPGYVNNEMQTREKFVQNPINNAFPETIYKTGDLAKYGEDGLLYFIGRKDTQIKRLGHRIELREIEVCAERIMEVEQAVCVYYEEKSKLYLFYISILHPNAVVTVLRDELPTHMIPDVCICVADIPMTKNGKTDRRLLLEKYLRGDYDEQI